MDNHKNSYNTNSDVVIIKCDEKLKARKRHCHKHYFGTKTRDENDHGKKTKSYSEKGNGHFKHKSQNIKVQRINFKCIINLNTTVCEHKYHRDYKCQRNKGSKGSYSNTAKCNEYDKDRKVPCCFRRNCRIPRHDNRDRKERRWRHHHLDSKRQHEEAKKGMKYAQKNRVEIKEKHHNYKPNFLSPVSSSPLKYEYANLTYEDISNTSFEDSFTKPMSYKNVGHDSYTCLDSKIDTLIKRTKERERKMLEHSMRTQKRHINTSTPLPMEISSDEFPSSFSDTSAISIQSLSTYIVGPQTDISSPEPQEFDKYYPAKKEPKLDSSAYSPTQTIHSELPKLGNVQTNIKVEATVDSNTVSYQHNLTLLKQENKQYNESINNNYIKNEPQYKQYTPGSPVIDTVHDNASRLVEEKNNNDLKYFRSSVKSVKIKSESD